ncbi:hypothetical protein ACVJBD_007503 [Rhizobium mongolense]
MVRRVHRQLALEYQPRLGLVTANLCGFLTPFGLAKVKLTD